jgi:YD repeat-containing protein
MRPGPVVDVRIVPSQTGHETTTNAYDAAGQLTSVTAPAATTSGSPPPTQVTDYDYDDAGELLTVAKEGSDSSAKSVTVYCYDPNGEKTAVVAPDGNTSSVTTCSSSSPYQTSSGYQTGYEYDSLGELVSKTTPTTPAVTDPTWAYSYDPAGNLLTSDVPNGVTTTNTYSPLDQLLTVSYSDSTPFVTYAYDANGNRVSMVEGTGTSSYGYDVFDGLTTDKNGAGNDVCYGYDEDGRCEGVTCDLRKVVCMTKMWFALPARSAANTSSLRGKRASPNDIASKFFTARQESGRAYSETASKSGSNPNPGWSTSCITPCRTSGSGKLSRSGFGFTSISPRPTPPNAARRFRLSARPTAPPCQ